MTWLLKWWIPHVWVVHVESSCRIFWGKYDAVYSGFFLFCFFANISKEFLVNVMAFFSGLSFLQTDTRRRRSFISGSGVLSRSETSAPGGCISSPSWVWGTSRISSAPFQVIISIILTHTHTIIVTHTAWVPQEGKVKLDGVRSCLRRRLMGRGESSLSHFIWCRTHRTLVPHCVSMSYQVGGHSVHFL